MRFKAGAFGAAMLLGFVAAGSASAGLSGTSVDVVYYFPDLSSVYADLGTTTVGPGVEYPDFQGQFAIDVSDESLTFTQLSDVPYAVGAFNGFEMNLLSGVKLTGVSLDPSSTYSPVGFGLLNAGSTVFLNLEGLSVPEGDTVVLDFTTTGPNSGVPEPATWALMLIGCGGLGGMMRLRRRQAAATA